MEGVELSALRLVAGRQKTTSSSVGQTGLHPNCLRVLVKVEDDSPFSLGVSQPQRTNKLDLEEIIYNDFTEPLLSPCPSLLLTLDGQRKPW